MKFAASSAFNKILKSREGNSKFSVQKIEFSLLFFHEKFLITFLWEISFKIPALCMKHKKYLSKNQHENLFQLFILFRKIHGLRIPFYLPTNVDLF